jgi:hypothetical protein
MRESQYAHVSSMAGVSTVVAIFCRFLRTNESIPTVSWCRTQPRRRDVSRSVAEGAHVGVRSDVDLGAGEGSIGGDVSPVTVDYLSNHDPC